MEEITIYKFQLEQIIDALRLTGNIYGCRDRKTAYDRTVTLAEKYAKNALNGEIDKREKSW